MKEIEKCFKDRFKHKWDAYGGFPLARVFSDAIAKQEPVDAPTILSPKTLLPPTTHASLPTQPAFLRILFAPILFPIWLVSLLFRPFWKWLRKIS